MDTNEQEVRRLRDAVYGPCSEANWNATRQNWMRPDSLEWLRGEVKRIEAGKGAGAPK